MTGLSDVVAGGFDAAIGAKERAPADMIAVQVTKAHEGTPWSVRRRTSRVGDAPRTTDDLSRHSCIQYRWGDSMFVWSFQRREQERGGFRCRCSHRSTVPGWRFVQRSTGSRSPLIKARIEAFVRSGQLVRVLEDAGHRTMKGYFRYCSGRRQVPAALQALIDMIRIGRDPPKHCRQLRILSRK